MDFRELHNDYKIVNRENAYICSGCHFEKGDSECALTVACQADFKTIYVKRQPEKNK